MGLGKDNDHVALLWHGQTTPELVATDGNINQT